MELTAGWGFGMMELVLHMLSAHEAYDLFGSHGLPAPKVSVGSSAEVALQLQHSAKLWPLRIAPSTPSAAPRMG